VTISPEKIILQREKEHCAIFIRARFICGLRLGLGTGEARNQKPSTGGEGIF